LHYFSKKTYLSEVVLTSSFITFTTLTNLPRYTQVGQTWRS